MTYGKLKKMAVWSVSHTMSRVSCRGLQDKFWRVQNGEWAERDEIHKVKITTTFSLYLFIENLNILLKYSINLQHFIIQ